MVPESPFLFSSVMSVFPEGLTDSVIVGHNVHHLTNLSTWLKPVAQSESSKWKRCWRASVDGWNASTFHSGCDNKGPTVTITRVGGKYIFGGYTNLSWGKWSNFNILNTIQSRPPFSITVVAHTELEGLLAYGPSTGPSPTIVFTYSLHFNKTMFGNSGLYV